MNTEISKEIPAKMSSVPKKLEISYGKDFVVQINGTLTFDDFRTEHMERRKNESKEAFEKRVVATWNLICDKTNDDWIKFETEELSDNMYDVDDMADQLNCDDEIEELINDAAEKVDEDAGPYDPICEYCSEVLTKKELDERTEKGIKSVCFDCIPSENGATNEEEDE